MDYAKVRLRTCVKGTFFDWERKIEKLIQYYNRKTVMVVKDNKKMQKTEKVI